ncbi:alpha/beta fold hydrolase [Homoserinibacter sp. YIM 151385]|uniref:alpha/beta fold hydrolase n=1 Tax=Homoserinibacter sp. YIM 151385 TaxID=2985506 RepID=UPI0022F11F3C|nr:alpha/beta fold hydrolase [Homoserinibacter sp. YIM 151385]WBU39101.1 alpha/beta fold hydrolase [Homoserinibacter sp. YIM 151385]
MPVLADAPPPRIVMTSDGRRLATYDTGGPDGAPVVVALHGFASSGLANWMATGWFRDLGRAGVRVLALDQRGHGASDHPHEPAAYSMPQLVDDLLRVLDDHLLDEVDLLGYSLGARVGWHAALELPTRIRRAVLGGIPDGDPLTRFDVPGARAHLADGAPLGDRLTRTYLEMAAGIRGNDLEALVSLVEGMRGGPQPDPADPPRQPVLIATGAEDRILEQSRGLAAALPAGRFLEIPGRDHFNAPTSRVFRDAAVAFLTEPSAD